MEVKAEVSISRHENAERVLGQQIHGEGLVQISDGTWVCVSFIGRGISKRGHTC